MIAWPTPICWVCGKKLGGKSNLPNQTCAVVVDPGGTAHRVHHVCVKDADGVKIRTEPV